VGVLSLLVNLHRALSAQIIQVDATPGHSTNVFRPVETLGASVDRITPVATEAIFTTRTLRRILSAGWQTISYRQNTEESVEAWHWNPRGTWSEVGQKGYFVGDSKPTKEWIRHSFGYQLPRSGFTYVDDNGYSHLTDGDVKTYGNQRRRHDFHLGRQRPSCHTEFS